MNTDGCKDTHEDASPIDGGGALKAPIGRVYSGFLQHNPKLRHRLMASMAAI